MKKIAIVQSNYIPWKGYFELIRSVDEFILYDDAQYTTRDWRNRNRIKTPKGPAWLTVPVETSGLRFQAVKDVRTAGGDWAKRHWQAIARSYGKAPHFKRYAPVFMGFYLERADRRLSLVNRALIEIVNGILGIPTKLSFSMDYPFERRAGKSEKILEICARSGATEYVSGPSAEKYLDRALFEKNGVRVRFADYSGHPEYPQLFPPFVHEVSVLDLIFNTGPEASTYMKQP